ncbi:MAG: hypothetical protein JNN28_07840 [Saprospiraceae bacterium]|nr:hypothetical protein [Saprospiraceae bacterium]
MDTLEKRIKALQESMDEVEMPDTQAIWAGVVTLPEKKAPWWRKPFWWIAFGLVLLGAGVSLGYWWSESKHLPAEQIPIAELPEPWRNKALEYQKQVSEQETQMHALLTANTQLPLEAKELEELDRLQQDFMADFQALPKDEKTAARYLHYYEQKIRILELIIKQIQLRKNETEKRRSLDI